jgi:hypothetical protein
MDRAEIYNNISNSHTLNVNISQIIFIPVLYILLFLIEQNNLYLLFYRKILGKAVEENKQK